MINKLEICGGNTAKLSLLSKKEKEELLIKIKAGDNEARDIFVNGNLRLVLSIIQRFYNRGESADDLFQIWCIGLIKAIDNFDLSQNVQFSTYAEQIQYPNFSEIKKHTIALYDVNSEQEIELPIDEVMRYIETSIPTRKMSVNDRPTIIHYYHIAVETDDRLYTYYIYTENSKVFCWDVLYRYLYSRWRYCWFIFISIDNEYNTK